MGIFFESERDKAARGEDGLRLSSAVPKIKWYSNPQCLYAIRLWETFTITFYTLWLKKNSEAERSYVLQKIKLFGNELKVDYIFPL